MARGSIPVCRGLPRAPRAGPMDHRGGSVGRRACGRPSRLR